jgi:CDGSH-type Zn-finger protein
MCADYLNVQVYYPIMTDQHEPSDPVPAITAAPNGPFLVSGSVPLYRRRSVESEHGEPLAWETTAQIETRDRYALCRCGDSDNKPFCDGTHARAGFTADDRHRGSYDERSTVLGGTGITVRDDRSICVHAGFCGTRLANVWGQVPETSESTVRAQVISMIEKCPSGALTFRFDGDDVEPLMPEAIAVTDDGPLWVTGGIPVTLADGTTLETRNRVTLCRCGQSANKPLCDGSHKSAGFHDRAS